MNQIIFTIDNRKKSPILEQVIYELTNLISNQIIPSGFVFDNLSDISKNNHIELSVLEKALEKLYEHHLLIKINDLYQVSSIVFKSTFFDEIMTYDQAILDAGYQLRIHTIDESLSNAFYSPHFKLDTLETNYFRWDRIYFANDIPIIRVISHYPLTLFKDKDILSIHHSIKTSDYLKITQSSRDIKSLIPHKEINQSLNQPIDATCLEFIYTNYHMNYPIEFAVAYASNHYAIFTQTSIYNPIKKDN